VNILTTYTLKYLRLNKKRTVVTILGVVLSSALICGVFLLGVSFQKVMIDHEIFMSGNWHAQFLAVPYAKAKYITGNSAVQTAMLSEPLGSATDGSHNTVRPYLYVTAYDALSFQNQSIQLISGRFPQKPDELLISPVMIADSGLGLKLGSTLRLAFGKRNIPNYDELVKAWGGEEYVALQDGETFTPSVSKTYTVVGLMAPRSDETSMPAAFPALTYLDPAQLTAADKVDISILTRDPRSIDTSAREIAKDADLTVTPGPDGQPTNISYNEVLLPWLGGSGRSNYVRSFLLILVISIALIVGGSVLVIYNAFAISISERKKQFGMFASVGATSAQIQEGKPLNLHTSPLIRRVFGFEGELALKSLQRDRKRYLTTLLSLMISIILFVAFNALMLYTNTTQRMASKAMNFDLIVDLDYRQSHAKNFVDTWSASYQKCSGLPTDAPPTSSTSPARAVITDPAYQALQELNSLKLENLPRPVEGGTYGFVLQVSAVGPSEFAHYAAQLGLDVQQYSDPSAPLGILLNHTTLRQGGKLYDFDLLGFLGGNITLVPELIVSDAVFDGLSDRLLQLGPINPGAMYIQSDNPVAAVAALQRLYQGTVGGNFSYYSTAELNKNQNLQTLMTNLFFYGFLALITLIGVTNIVNTLDTNIKMRRREIAMLKSVGLTPGGFLRMLRYESLFYGLTALLYGLPLGIVLSVVIYSQFGGVSTFAFTLPWGAIAACVLGILAIVFATMMVSGAMIRNDNIVDTIKDENL